MTTDQLRLPMNLRPAFPTGAGLPTLLITALGAGGAAYAAVDLPHLYRATLAIALGLTLIVLGIRWPLQAALGALLLLPFLGLARRLLIADTGWVKNDPLLVVAPVVAIFLLCRLFFLEQRRFDRDLLAKLVLAMLALTVVQVFNFLGSGTVTANLGGLIFMGVPLVWFFLGRELLDDRAASFLLHAVVVIAIVVGTYGLFQTELAPAEGLPSWDQAWYDVAGYAALNVGQQGNDQIRPFSTFASNGEYSAYLSLALIVIFALVAHRRPVTLLAVPWVAFALFSSGGRSGMALTALAIVVMLGVLTRNLGIGILVAVLGVGAVYGLAVTVGPRLDRAAGLSGKAISERNVGGLLHPLDPGQSSALARWQNLTGGITDGFKNPAGQGTGATNLAGRNLSDTGVGRETDNDVADVFVSLGAVGGLLYVAIIFLSFKAVFTRYAREKNWMLFAAGGFLVGTFGVLLNGGMYAVVPLTWFLLGWATRPPPVPDREEELAPGRPAQVAVPA
jgi:hypothetical protein